MTVVVFVREALGGVMGIIGMELRSLGISS